MQSIPGDDMCNFRGLPGKTKTALTGLFLFFLFLLASATLLSQGRASMTPILDLFITLLSMGVHGYQQLLQERSRLVPIVREGLEKFAAKFGQRVLLTPRNSISIGVSLEASGLSEKDLSFFGSMLFQRNVSGCRVVTKSYKQTNISGVVFSAWGAHSAEYPCSYFTVACSIGLVESEVILFLSRLDSCYVKFLKRLSSAEVKKPSVLNGANSPVIEAEGYQQDDVAGSASAVSVTVTPRVVAPMAAVLSAKSSGVGATGDAGGESVDADADSNPPVSSANLLPTASSGTHDRDAGALRRPFHFDSTVMIAFCISVSVAII